MKTLDQNIKVCRHGARMRSVGWQARHPGQGSVEVQI